MRRHCCLWTIEKQTVPLITDALAVLANMTAEFTLDEEQRSWPEIRRVWLSTVSFYIRRATSTPVSINYMPFGVK